MDSPKAITHVSICAGYGGIDLGLKRAIPGLRTIAFSEIEAFAVANLVAKMEAGRLDVAPIWANLKTFPWGKFRGFVDILSGGYPCQPFSSAGKRRGRDDPRHLWPWIADGILAMQPGLCFFENVEGHISLGLEDVLLDLSRIGYQSTFGIFSAAELGAPHQRKRLFILAHRNEPGLQGSIPAGVADSLRRQEPGNGYFGSGGRNGSELADSDDGRSGQNQQPGKLWANRVEQSSRNSWDAAATGTEQIWPSRPGQNQFAWEPPRVVADAENKRPGKAWGLRPDGPAHGTAGSGEAGTVGDAALILGNGCNDNPTSCGRFKAFSKPRDTGGANANAVRQTQSAMGGDADGSAGRMDYAELCVSGDNRTDELRLLGNGVVPATAERAFRVLSRRLLT